VRRGFALAFALGALVVVAALAAALTFVAEQQRHAARQLLAGERALALAEWALADVPAAWQGAAVGALVPGETRERTVVLETGDSAHVRLTRAGARTAWAVVAAEAGAGRDRARRSVAALFVVGGAAPDSAVLVPVTPRGWMRTF
jgi:hypothetical protein